MMKVALYFCFIVSCLILGSDAQLIVTLTGPCAQGLLQVASSGTMIPFLDGVPHDLGNVPLCDKQPNSRFCSFSMMLVCVENSGAESFLYSSARCSGPEPVLGLCVPSAELCPTPELQRQVTNWSRSDTTLQQAFSPAGYCSFNVPSRCNLTLSYSYLQASCLDETPSFLEDSAAVAVFAVIMTLVGLCFVRPLFSTLHYVFFVLVTQWIKDENAKDIDGDDKEDKKEGEESKPKRVGIVKRLFVWFDLFENLCEFFRFRSRATKVAAGVVDTQFFEGLRTISMLFVLYGHTFFFPVESGVDNTETAITWLRSYAGIGIFPAELAVDTFFYLSGFLTFHLLIKHTEKTQETKLKKLAAARREERGVSMMETDAAALLIQEEASNAAPQDAASDIPLRPLGPIDTLLLYVRRWLRMTPVVMLTLCSAVWLLRYIPTHDVMYPTLGNQETLLACKEHWWRQLLYINNLHDMAGWMHCMDWFWYLSCDFQMFIAAPIFLLPYYAHEKYGAYLWTVLAACAILTMTILQNYYGSYIGSDGSYYDKAWMRASPYLYGGIAAVLIRQAEVRSLVASPRRRVTLYFIATLLMVSSINVMWAAMRCYQGGGPASGECTQQFFNFTNAWATFAFGLGLLLISLPWVCGHGGGLCRFLSNPVFVVLSKLTFCMYMLHPIVIMAALASARSYPFFSAILLYKEFTGVFVITSVSALALHLVAEVPFAKLNDALTK